MYCAGHGFPAQNGPRVRAVRVRLKYKQRVAPLMTRSTYQSGMVVAVVLLATVAVAAIIVAALMSSTAASLRLHAARAEPPATTMTTALFQLPGPQHPAPQTSRPLPILQPHMLQALQVLQAAVPGAAPPLPAALIQDIANCAEGRAACHVLMVGWHPAAATAVLATHPSTRLTVVATDVAGWEAVRAASDPPTPVRATSDPPTPVQPPRLRRLGHDQDLPAALTAEPGLRHSADVVLLMAHPACPTAVLKGLFGALGTARNGAAWMVVGTQQGGAGVEAADGMAASCLWQEVMLAHAALPLQARRFTFQRPAVTVLTGGIGEAYAAHWGGAVAALRAWAAERGYASRVLQPRHVPPGRHPAWAKLAACEEAEQAAMQAARGGSRAHWLLWIDADMVVAGSASWRDADHILATVDRTAWIWVAQDEGHDRHHVNTGLFAVKVGAQQHVWQQVLADPTPYPLWDQCALNALGAAQSWRGWAVVPAHLMPVYQVFSRRPDAAAQLAAGGWITHFSGGEGKVQFKPERVAMMSAPATPPRQAADGLVRVWQWWRGGAHLPRPLPKAVLPPHHA